MNSIITTKTDERFIVDVIAPGYAKENVQVKAKVSDEKKITLVINVSEAKVYEKFGAYKNLCGFKEKVDINDEILDLSKISADVVNGIIRISIPKKDDYKTKTLVDFAPSDPAPENA